MRQGLLADGPLFGLFASIPDFLDGLGFFSAAARKQMIEINRDWACVPIPEFPYSRRLKVRGSTQRSSACDKLVRWGGLIELNTDNRSSELAQVAIQLCRIRWTDIQRGSVHVVFFLVYIGSLRRFLCRWKVKSCKRETSSWDTPSDNQQRNSAAQPITVTTAASLRKFSHNFVSSVNEL